MSNRWLADLAGTLRDFTVKGILTVTGVTKLQAALQLFNAASAPLSPSSGWMYYDTIHADVYFYDGGTWQRMLLPTDITTAVYNAQFVTAQVNNFVGAGVYNGTLNVSFLGNGMAPALAVGIDQTAAGEPSSLVVATPGASGNTFTRYPIAAGARTNSASGAWGTTAMSSGDVLFVNAAIGDAGSGTNGNGQTGGYLQWVCDSAWSNTHYPTRVELYLCSSSSTTPSKVLTVTPDGKFSPNFTFYNVPQAFPGAATSGQAYAYSSTTLGLVLYGCGSNGDITIANRAGTAAITVIANSTQCAFAAQLSSTLGYGSAYNAVGTVGSTLSLNFAAGTNVSFTLTSATNITVSVGTAPSLPCDITIKVVAPASGTLPTITWPATFKGFPTTFSALGKTHTLRAHYDGTNYLLIGSQQNY